MAKIEMDRPFFCFNDEGHLEAFDADGRKIEPDRRNLADILASLSCQEMAVEAIPVITVRGSCYKLVYVEGVGWVMVPC